MGKKKKKKSQNNNSGNYSVYFNTACSHLSEMYDCFSVIAVHKNTQSIDCMFFGEKDFYKESLESSRVIESYDTSGPNFKVSKYKF